MSVLFTDTDCEMDWRDVEKYGIKVLGMPYILDGEEKVYDMGKDTEAIAHFYKRVREGSMPLTAALNPADYVNYFEPVLAAGEDIFYIHFSDQLSGTFNYMKLALDELMPKYPERKITTFTPRTFALAVGLLFWRLQSANKLVPATKNFWSFWKDLHQMLRANSWLTALPT